MSSPADTSSSHSERSKESDSDSESVESHPDEEKKNANVMEIEENEKTDDEDEQIPPVAEAHSDFARSRSNTPSPGSASSKSSHSEGSRSRHSGSDSDSDSHDDDGGELKENVGHVDEKVEDEESLHEKPSVSSPIAGSPKSSHSGRSKESDSESESDSQRDEKENEEGMEMDMGEKSEEEEKPSIKTEVSFPASPLSSPPMDASPKSNRSGRSKHSGSDSEFDSHSGEEKENEGQNQMGVDVKAEEEEEPLPETRIDVEIPKISTDLGKSVHFVKLPNFLSVETRPFDSNTYEDEIDDEETLDEEGRARLKLKVENTIRWRERFNEKGVFVKESNARFVRWSDGSLSLHLGDEIFNVERQALHGDHNHLFIRQGTGLQGQAVFRTKLTFRPHSTESFTHRKMTMSLADRSTKAQGIKVLSSVGANPEAHRDVLIKKEEGKLRASVRRENKQRRVRERASAKGLSNSYLDDEYSDEDNSISIAAIKNRYKKGGVRPNIFTSDEDDGSDLEQGRRLEKAKRLKDSEEEDEAERSDGASGKSAVGAGSGGEGSSQPAEESAIVSSSTQ